MKKEQAKEKYDDAIAAGNTGVKLNVDEKLPDLIELSIGQLQPKTTAEITIKMVSELEVISAGFFTFLFPMEFIPRYGNKEGLLERKVVPAKFSMNMKVSASSVVSDLHMSHSEMIYEQSEDGKALFVKILEADSFKANDIVISYKSQNIREPQVTLTKNSKFPGEVAVQVSYIPRSSEEEEQSDGKIFYQILLLSQKIT